VFDLLHILLFKTSLTFVGVVIVSSLLTHQGALYVMLRWRVNCVKTVCKTPLLSLDVEQYAVMAFYRLFT